MEGVVSVSDADQRVDVQQVNQGKSWRSLFTISAVMIGAPGPPVATIIPVMGSFTMRSLDFLRRRGGTIRKSSPSGTKSS